ncbi:MAG: DUF1028 domain-containing protein [Anaerolineales bacterium]|jgi:uncharacterized Ntn-hydrolase superfamily protein
MTKTERYTKTRWIATFSIVAIDPATRQIGAAVQSKAFAVGNVVPWVKAGIGAIATQAYSLASYGNQLLSALEKGEKPEAALQQALSKDSLASQRQIGLVNASGESAVHTGTDCLEWAGGISKPGFAVQGNILAGEDVVQAMAQAFSDTSGGLGYRLLIALEAGQAAGGDRRGQQSAALIVEQSDYHQVSSRGIDRLIDLRVDDHTAPIAELRRLYGIWEHNNMLEIGLIHYNNQDYSAAVKSMVDANQKYPDDAPILYNLACFEALAGNPVDSLEHLGQAISLDRSFRDAARTDADFDSLRDQADFKELLEPGRS